MSLKFIIYGNQYYHCKIYDLALKFFTNSDFISYELLYSGNPPENTTVVFKFLESEGLVKFDRYGVKITEKGKKMVTSGGFMRNLLIERIKFVGVIAGIISVLIAIITFFSR